MKIGIIGFGSMGSAIGIGLIKNNHQVYYNDLVKKDVEGAIFQDIEFLIEQTKYIILAIKPYQYEEMLQKYDFSNNVVISIAAGITSEFMSRLSSKYILTMPNTPAMIMMGHTVIVKNTTVSDQEISEVTLLFDAVGKTSYCLEEQLPLMICLSGSSPAYFFNFIDKLANTFIQYGMSKEDATKQLASVMLSSASLILSSENSAETLTKNVCSPNGTTIQAIDTFNQANLEAICSEAIKKCYNRALELEIK